MGAVERRELWPERNVREIGAQMGMNRECFQKANGL